VCHASAAESAASSRDEADAFAHRRGAETPQTAPRRDTVRGTLLKKEVTPEIRIGFAGNVSPLGREPNDFEQDFIQRGLHVSPRASGAEKLSTGCECRSAAFGRWHARRRKTDTYTHPGPDGQSDTHPDANRAYGKDCVRLQRRYLPI